MLEIQPLCSTNHTSAPGMDNSKVISKNFLLSFFLFFKTGSDLFQIKLELTIYPSLASTSQQPSCLGLPCSGILGVHDHTWLKIIFTQ